MQEFWASGLYLLCIYLVVIVHLDIGDTASEIMDSYQ